MIFIGLGGNVGDVEANLSQAKKLIHHLIAPIEKSSSLYKSSAWGITDQPDFLNQVVGIETAMRPLDVLRKLQFFEQLLGRENRAKWREREIDLDLLFYNSEIYETENLIIPHPFFHKRNFTLVPMLEICPYFVHPKLNLTIEELCKDLTDLDKIKRYKQ